MPTPLPTVREIEELLELAEACHGKSYKLVSVFAPHLESVCRALLAERGQRMQMLTEIDQQHARCEELADIAEKAAKLGKAVSAERDAQAARVEELEAELAACKAELSQLRAGAWVPVSERLPESGQRVLAFVRRDGPFPHADRIRAFYAAKQTIGSVDADDDWTEYSEDKDEYFLPEGWYETNHYEETHWHVADRVTHWMPLPHPPAANPATDGQGGRR